MIDILRSIVQMRRLAVSFISALASALTLCAHAGMVTDVITSAALSGNLLGDPDTRELALYLPPSYHAGDIRYPVVYYLHGYTSDHNMWINVGIEDAMDELIQNGSVQEMIVVLPNAFNSHLGSFYASSSVTGDYETYMTEEVVDFVDSNYRTIPQRESRAIGGGSMGGQGAATLAFSRPDVYSGMVSHSGGVSMAQILIGGLLSSTGELWRDGPLWRDTFISMSLAFSPNPDTPDLYDYPLDDSGALRDDVWQRWLEHDPVTMVDTRPDLVRQLQGIYFDHGTADTIVDVEQSRDLATALDRSGIPYTYEEYTGDHYSHWPQRLHTALPFLSDLLANEIATPVAPRGKLTTTWASVKSGM